MGGSVRPRLHPLMAFFKLEAPPQAEVTVQMARRHSAFVGFASAGVDDSAEVPSIAARGRFVCSRCRGYPQKADIHSGGPTGSEVPRRRSKDDGQEARTRH